MIWAKVANSRTYKLDRLNEDRKLDANQFVRWLRIKNPGGIRPLLKDKTLRRRRGVEDIAALVLISRTVSGSGYNPDRRRPGRH